MRLLKNLVSFFVLMSLTSCLIENDMSYPRIRADITKLVLTSGEESYEATLDPENRVASFILPETADITHLKVARIELSEKAYMVEALPEYLDLSESDYNIKLRTYQDYEWTISAERPIARYITCENQVGEASIDLSSREATVYVLESQPLKEIVFTSMKLEIEGSEIVSTTGWSVVDGKIEESTVECNFPMTLDCVVKRKFTVRHGEEEIIWTVAVVQKAVELAVKSVNAWCYHADVIAAYDGTGDPKMYFRKADADSWYPVEPQIDGQNITITLTDLEPGCDYALKLENGDSYVEAAFRTGTPDQLPNMSFDDWYQGSPNNTWYPAVSKDSPDNVWDTANPGTNMLQSLNPSRPETDFVAVAGEGKKAARLESMVVFGKLAAGNILTGRFLKASVTGGVGADLTWGTPFTGRPKALKGYYAYSPKTIDYYTDRFKDKVGKNDYCQLLVILADWDEPFLVQTATGTFVDQVNDPHIIAHGTIESNESTNGEYVPFECKLNYRDLTRTPKYAVVIACASLYGDYFTGGKGSVMYVDEFEFVYD